MMNFGFLSFEPPSDNEEFAKLDPQRAKLYGELAAMRRLAFASVSISVIATLLAVFMVWFIVYTLLSNVFVFPVPFLHAQIQYMQSMAQEELHFCRTRTSTFWKEIGKTGVIF